MKTTCNHLHLDLLTTGELGEADAVLANQHIAQCGECAAYVARLQAESVAFHDRHPFSSFTRAHAPLKALPWYRRLALQVFRPAFIPVAAALLLSVSILPYIVTTQMQRSTVVRFKGGNSIRYIYKKDGEVKNSALSDRFGAGDRIQVLYSSVKKQYLALVSIDAVGSISFYHPDASGDTCSISVSAGAEHTYPSSIEFDASSGYELICALFTEQPLTISAVQSWLQKAYTQENNLVDLQSVLKRDQQLLGAECLGLLVTKE